MKVIRLLAFTGLLTLLGCKQAPTPPAAATDPVVAPVATVNGSTISRDMFDFYAKAASGNGKPKGDYPMNFSPIQFWSIPKPS